MCPVGNGKVYTDSWVTQWADLVRDCNESLIFILPLFLSKHPQVLARNWAIGPTDLFSAATAACKVTD